MVKMSFLQDFGEKLKLAGQVRYIQLLPLGILTQIVELVIDIHQQELLMKQR